MKSEEWIDSHSKTPEQVRAMSFELFKFIKFQGDKWRFWHMDICAPNHNEMVKQGEVPVAAGIIGVRDDSIKMENPYSGTLGIGTKSETYSELESILGLPFEE